mmetsp:Transcript_29113/g.64139  ORF Transcript_29113/g.64139 Transcript_29113/m.64139 type:complete len:384 (-) Transcript_29113:1957-3108(-)
MLFSSFSAPDLSFCIFCTLMASFLPSSSADSAFFDRLLFSLFRILSSLEQEAICFSTSSSSALASSYFALISPTFISISPSASLASSTAFSAATTASSDATTSALRLSSSSTEVSAVVSASRACLALAAAAFFDSLTLESISFSRFSLSLVSSASFSLSSLYRFHLASFSDSIVSNSSLASSNSLFIPSYFSDSIPYEVWERCFSAPANSASAISSSSLSLSNFLDIDCIPSSLVDTLLRRASLVSSSVLAVVSSVSFPRVDPRLFLDPPEMVPDGSNTSPSRVTVRVLVSSQILLAASMPSTTMLDPNTYSTALRTSSSKPTSSIAAEAVVPIFWAIEEARSAVASVTERDWILSRGIMVTRRLSLPLASRALPVMASSTTT